MIGVARRILFRQDLAEEAVHDAFIRIWRGAAGFTSIAAARAAGSMRWSQPRLSIHRNEHRYELSAKRRGYRLRSHAVADAETSALRRCLERIDRPRRDVVVLAYVHGMSHGELAGRRAFARHGQDWVRRSLFALQECMG